MSSAARRLEVAGTSYDLSAISREIECVASYIEGIRIAISGLGVLDLTDIKLSGAQADLRDVMSTTAKATDTILETAEYLLEVEGTGPEYRAIVEARMFGLMEACGFQDITGQRLTRALHALQAVEERLKIFAHSARAKTGDPIRGKTETERALRNERNLLHGPGGPGSIAQHTVDDLLHD